LTVLAEIECRAWRENKCAYYCLWTYLGNLSV